MSSVRRALRAATDETWVARAARTGIAVRGMVFLVLAYLIIRIASGALGGSSTGTAASGPGIADAVAQQTGGRVVVFALGVGLVCYALLSLLDAVTKSQSSDAKRWGERAISAWAFVVYAAFAGYAFATALDGHTSSGSSQQSDSKQAHWSARVLAWPAGWLWLGALGLVLVVIAVVFVVRAVRGSFRDCLDRKQMSAREWRTAAVLGGIGQFGRAALFGIAGWFVAAAAIRDDPSDSQGVDGSVRRLAAHPTGAAALYVVAAAIICFGCYLLVLESRYRRL